DAHPPRRGPEMSTLSLSGRSGVACLRSCRQANDAYAKGMSRLDSSGQFKLGGEKFSWNVKHYAGESSVQTHRRGISARVCLADAQTRELVIEFDPLDYPPKKPPSTAQLSARIQEYTQKAIATG